jgi:hypothetical protein
MTEIHTLNHQCNFMTWQHCISLLFPDSWLKLFNAFKNQIFDSMYKIKKKCIMMSLQWSKCLRRIALRHKIWNENWIEEVPKVDSGWFNSHHVPEPLTATCHPVWILYSNTEYLNNSWLYIWVFFYASKHNTLLYYYQVNCVHNTWEKLFYKYTRYRNYGEFAEFIILYLQFLYLHSTELN